MKSRPFVAQNTKYPCVGAVAFSILGSCRTRPYLECFSQFLSSNREIAPKSDLAAPLYARQLQVAGKDSGSTAEDQSHREKTRTHRGPGVYVPLMRASCRHDRQRWVRGGLSESKPGSSSLRRKPMQLGRNIQRAVFQLEPGFRASPHPMLDR